MRHLIRLRVLALAAVFLGLWQQGRAASLDGPVAVWGGLVAGSAGAVPGVRVFRGIPYAAPPVSALRWRPPQPVAAWQGVRPSAATPDCPQPPRSTLPGMALPGPQSEDCLYLNIWTPAKTPAERLPVMVWIYGGGFRSGSANDPRFDGSHLAAKGVVDVDFNYRLGALGFLAYPALSAEAGYHASGNYGLLDMVAVLRWVRANITAFGGDPDRVTIFGQSAGSMATNLLTASPLAKGLFQRVIGQSGAALGANSYTTLKPLSYGERNGAAFVHSLGVQSLAELRALPLSAFINAQTGAAVGAIDPVIDGYFLPADVRDVYQQGRQNDVPMLLGHTTRESSQLPPAPSAAAFRQLIKGCYPAAASDLFLQLFPAATDVEAAQSRDLSENILLGAWSMRGWAQLQTATGHAPVYLYSFDQAPPITPSRGAYHSSDLFYSYDNLDLFPLPWSAGDRRLADIMSSYWVNFAKNGDPNGTGLPYWPVYNAATDQRMQLKDDAVAQGKVPESVIIDILNRLKAEQRTLPPEQRC